MKWILLTGIVIAAAIWLLLTRSTNPSRPNNPSSSTNPAPDMPVLRTLIGAPLVQEVVSANSELFRMAVVRGDQAMEAIPKLDALGSQEGWLPVFIGAEGELPDFSALKAQFQAPSDILKQAEEINAAEFLRKRVMESSENDPDNEELLGTWPDEDDASMVSLQPYSVFRDVLTNKYHDKIYIALVPTDEAWKIPAYLQNGGWNEVPNPSEQVSVLHYWQDRYSARLRTFSNDVMELEVAKPPLTRDQGLALAKEQFGFCSDIVYQGVGAIRPLARGLQNSHNWYFWWD